MTHELHELQQLFPIPPQLGRQPGRVGQGFGEVACHPNRHPLLVSPVSLDHPMPLEHREGRFEPSVVLAAREPLSDPGQAEGSDLFLLLDEQVMESLIDGRLGIGPLDELHLCHEVSFVVQQEAFRFEAIPPSAANLLIPRLH